MSIITFWSQGREQVGKSVAIGAIATSLAIKHNLRILVIGTEYKDFTLQKCFCEERKIKNLGVFGPNTNIDIENGIQGLSKIMRSNKISPNTITDYTKVILKDRLEILLSYFGNRSDYTEIAGNYSDIISLANQYYDLVLVDLAKKMEDENEILEKSDVIVACISQRLSNINRLIDERMKNAIIKSKKVIPLICRYDKFSKYTAKNVARYLGSRVEMCTIPYNTLYFEACEETKCLDYFLKIRKMDDLEDRNVFFVKEVEKTVSKILGKVDESKRMRMR